MITITVLKNKNNNKYGVYLAVDKETQLIEEFDKSGLAMIKLLSLGREIPFATQRIDKETYKALGNGRPSGIEVI